MPTLKAVVLKGKNQVKKNGTANIKIRITNNRKDAYIPTKYFVNTKHFNNKTGRVTKGKNKDLVNANLLNKLEEYTLKIIELGALVDYMPPQKIKEYFLSGVANSEQINFITWAEDYCKDVTSSGTRETYISLIKSLKAFRGPELWSSDINVNYLNDYARWLQNSRGLQNGIINYMKTFRSLFNKCRDAYNDEDTGRIVIPNYPFKKFEMPKRTERSREHVLTVSELRRFIAYHPVNDREQLAKDAFLLMVYLIGIEAKDLFYLAPAINGRVIYERFKTGGVFNIKVEPETLEIIERWQGNGFMVNFSERFATHHNFICFVNEYLHGRKARKKQVAVKGMFEKIGITKPVTTKWARHTWATIARNDCRINKDDVAHCLGHKDQQNRVTDTYIKYDTGIIDSCNRKVLDYIYSIE